MAALHSLEDEGVRAEIKATEAALERYRHHAGRAWNPEMAAKLAQQVAACERHLARLKALL
jgi:hypothetical protein